MVPMFKTNGHDYAMYIKELKPSRNDLDKDGSGRNLVNGLMYRNRIGSKRKWSVSFLKLDEDMMKQVEEDFWPQYVDITTLDPKLNRHVTRTYYTSTINNGIQKYDGQKTYYEGVTFDMTER